MIKGIVELPSQLSLVYRLELSLETGLYLLG